MVKNVAFADIIVRYESGELHRSQRCSGCRQYSGI